MTVEDEKRFILGMKFLEWLFRAKKNLITTEMKETKEYLLPSGLSRFSLLLNYTL